MTYELPTNTPMSDMNDEEIKEYMSFGQTSSMSMRPEKPYYRKSGGEIGPTWRQKREFMHKMINDSLVPPAVKVKMQEAYDDIARFQFRGFKYGLATSAATFFLLPVVRRQLFLRRFAISMIPMAAFLKYGYTWGHENAWRKAYKYLAVYEISGGTRNRFTGK